MISKTKLISKNIISLFLSFLILFTTSSTFVYAKTLDNADQSIDTIATELEFYFSKVGHFDKNNKYIITNPEL
ncbi:hypothetical protein [Clostridium tarantellae]|uniref:Uncharacterized protein n=1 Tax=Clostridium tarantellae TaxID=39493 RepID=A0A6I1MNS4_9CLOT|nr:hypothetical protein [Clostridium tarantellae]MPQ44610.1 hypothetical protein [Clostridium tarantellae]